MTINKELQPFLRGRRVAAWVQENMSESSSSNVQSGLEARGEAGRSVRRLLKYPEQR